MGKSTSYFDITRGYPLLHQPKAAVAAGPPRLPCWKGTARLHRWKSSCFWPGFIIFLPWHVPMFHNVLTMTLTSVYDLLLRNHEKGMVPGLSMFGLFNFLTPHATTWEKYGDHQRTWRRQGHVEQFQTSVRMFKGHRLVLQWQSCLLWTSGQRIVRNLRTMRAFMSCLARIQTTWHWGFGAVTPAKSSVLFQV